MDDKQTPYTTQCSIPSDSHCRMRSRDKLPRVSSWWLWELASLGLATCFTALTIAIITYMHDKPQSHWKLSIAPNSLVAIFSTLAKSALLFPLAECIGQLKWHYYEGGRALDEMDQFDRAGRGPWGAITFIVKLGKSAPFTAFGALTIVLMLAFEPFTQQVITFSTRAVPIADSGEFITKTNSWVHAATQGIDGTWKKNVVFPLEMGVIDVVARVPGHKALSPANNAYCPTTECQYVDFASLSACATCDTEVVQIENFTCTGTYNENPSVNGSSVAFNSYQEFKAQLPGDLEKWPNHVEINMTCVLAQNMTDESNHKFPPYPVNVLVEYNASSLSSNPIQSLIRLPKGKDDGYSMTCTHIERDGGLDAANGYGHWTLNGEPPSIDSFTCFQSTTQEKLYADLNYIGQINGTISRCAVDYCAKSLQSNSYKNGTFQSGKITEIPLTITAANNRTYNDVDTEFYTLQATGLNETFYISGIDAFFVEGYMSVTSTGFFDWQSYLDEFLVETNANFTQLFSGMADVLSGVIQSSYNINATKVTGVSYRAEVWVNVRWYWFIVPLSLLLATFAFSIGTILRSRKKEYLFKTSLVPCLLFGGKEIVGASVAAPPEGEKSSDHMLGLYGKIKLRLVLDERGNLKFKRD